MSASLAMVADAPATAITPPKKSIKPTHQGEQHVQVATQWLPASFAPVSSLTASYVPKCTACAGPAPNITDVTPRHSVLMPSVEDIRVNALPMPVYTAAGDVANTCIRVYLSGQLRTHTSGWGGRLTLILSTGNMTACSVMPACMKRHRHSNHKYLGGRILTNAPANIFTYAQKSMSKTRESVRIVSTDT